MINEIAPRVKAQTKTDTAEQEMLELEIKINDLVTKQSPISSELVAEYTSLLDFFSI